MLYSKEEFDELLNIFKVESEEIIQKFNENLLELEKNPENKTPIKELLHLAHSLKGAARMIGFNTIQNFAHKLEDLLSFWNQKNVKITFESFQFVYQVCDFLYVLIEKSVQQKSDYNCNDSVCFLNKFETFIDNITLIKIDLLKTPLDYIVNKEMDIHAALLEIMFILGKNDTEKDFENNMVVLKENLEQLQEIFKVTEYIEVKDKILFLITFLNNGVKQDSVEFLKECIIELRSAIYNLYKGLSLSVPNEEKQDKANLQIESVPLNENQSVVKDFEFIIKNLQKTRTNIDFTKEILEKLGDITKSNLNTKVVSILSKVDEILNFSLNQKQYLSNECYTMLLQSILYAQKLSLEDNNDEVNYISILQRLDVVKGILNAQTSTELVLKLKSNDFNQIKTVRVDISKLDSLINLTKKLISDIKNNADIKELYKKACEIETIVENMRILPLAVIFHAFPRMIRDLAKENNKMIDFIISGSDISVDKEILDEIKMPLLHILRNSVSHGIETPEKRLEHGKKETGTILLNVVQAENNIIITIQDDGAGVNIDKVKQKALQNNLLTQQEIDKITSSQLLELLFSPDFSTDDSVTEISGRGIGLDIVKTKITNLNGTIAIDSKYNQGCKITIQIPLRK